MAQLDAAVLQKYLADHIAGLGQIRDVTKFSDGQSNPTYLIKTDHKQLVLRKKPDGPILKSAHAVEREYRVMKALHGNFPVPRMRFLCEDPDIIGATFFVMDFVDGRVIWNPHIPDVSPTERAAIFDTLNATIARLHNIDVESSGLSDFGRPEGYVARQIKRWSEQYIASTEVEVAEMDNLRKRLVRDQRIDVGKHFRVRRTRLGSEDRAQVVLIEQGVVTDFVEEQSHFGDERDVGQRELRPREERLGALHGPAKLQDEHEDRARGDGDLWRPRQYLWGRPLIL